MDHMKFTNMLNRFLMSMMIVATLAWPAAADQAAVGPGSRLFVTKVYPGHGRLTEADFRQLADAGFTVVVNRWLEDIPPYCEGAADAGLAVMTWQMGMPDAPEGEEVDRTMTRLGKTTRFTLPFSAAGWQRVTDEIVEQARLSLQQPNLKGAIIDFEIYDPNRTDGFCESYDDASFIAFHQRVGKPLPDPLTPPAERRAYLDRLQVLSLYVEGQAERVGEQARKMRRAIDAINPRFQIGVYGWGAFKESVMRNLATTQAPVLDIEATLYGRTIYSNAFEGGYDADEPDRTGLRWSLITASEMARAARRRDYPVVLLAGHYPQSPGPADGSQYRYTVRQSFNSAAYADGYWIWTDWWLPEPWKDKQSWIDAMMAEWTQANAALDAGDWTWANRQPVSVVDTNAVVPRMIITTDGENVAAWNPISGEGVAVSGAFAWPGKVGPTLLGDQFVSIEGWHARATRDGKVIGSYLAGHGLRSVAVGEVDGIPGDELITLNAGWIKVWDPQTESQLLRFYVGPKQKEVQTISRDEFD
jgi:hypothetical protein